MPSRCFGFSHNPNWRYIVIFASQRRSARAGSHHGGAKKRSLSGPILFARQPETKLSSGRQAPCLLQRVPCRRFRCLAAGTQGDLAGLWRSFARPRPASTSHRDLRRRRASNGTGHRPPGRMTLAGTPAKMGPLRRIECGLCKGFESGRFGGGVPLKLSGCKKAMGEWESRKPAAARGD